MVVHAQYVLKQYNGFCDVTTDSVISIGIVYSGFCVPRVQSD